MRDDFVAHLSTAQFRIEALQERPVILRQIRLRLKIRSKPPGGFSDLIESSTHHMILPRPVGTRSPPVWCQNSSDDVPSLDRVVMVLLAPAAPDDHDRGMNARPFALYFVVSVFAGWMNRQQ